MRPKDLDAVRDLPLFAGLEEEHLEGLTKGAFLQRLPRDTLLFEEGDAADCLHVLVRGSAMLSGRNESSQETVIEIMMSGDCFVLAAPFRDLASREPPLARSVMSLLARQFRGMVRQVKDLKLCNTTQRLAGFILAHAKPETDGTSFELPISKRVLASRLGMSPEHLSRAFAKLSAHDLRVEGSTIQVGSIERLRRCCRQDAV
ncbi:helix-turn-helix domain-containing protein [Azospirillum soli]|uniref:helix-turn-helix domain-containing protein n=1 Tax=Azospirillum soli TaxID=1304799 RepID=UPI001AE66D1D|nr:helix-turn-helix domain-containing protein [Azospirillum soli]MBP2314255.1 CRP/FNR family transcriptional activator FtrB [Azospirillum soli]